MSQLTGSSYFAVENGALKAKIAEQEQTIAALRERNAELTYRLQTWDDSHAEMTAKVLAERDLALSELAARNMDVKNLLVILDAQIEISECDIEDEDRVIVEQIRMEVHATLTRLLGTI